MSFLIILGIAAGFYFIYIFAYLISIIGVVIYSLLFTAGENFDNDIQRLTNKGKK